MIYFAAPDGVPDLVKIGFTAGEVPKRIAELQTASPFPLAITGTSEGDRAREKMLHAIFKEHRTVGEWFKVDPSEVARVNGILDTPRMAAMLGLRPRQFATLSKLLEATSIRETFVRGLEVSGFDELLRDATARPKAIPRLRVATGRKKPGPPPGEGKTPQRSIRVSKADWAAWDKAAREQGLTLSDWIRLVCNRNAKRKQ